MPPLSQDTKDQRTEARKVLAIIARESTVAARSEASVRITAAATLLQDIVIEENS